MTDSSARSQPLGRFEQLACVLVVGYLIMSRSFAHLGLRPFYIGEVALVAFILAQPASLVRPFVGALVRSVRLSPFVWTLALSLIYGVAQCLRSLASGQATFAIAEIFIFHVYPLYLLIGLWVGTRHQELLPRLVRFLAWAHGLYGVAYIGVFSPMGWTDSLDDPTALGWFGQPGGCALVLLGLLAFEPHLGRFLIPIGLNVMVLLGMQRRAEWLALAAAITLWAILAGRFQRLLVYYGAIAALLVVGLVFDVRVPSPATRGGEISTRDLVGRALAAVAPDLAESLNRDADGHAATVHFRSDFWNGIWKEVHRTSERALLGFGYDYPIWQLSFEDLSEAPVRSPHSALFFALGYSGWSGLLIYLALQATIGWLLWRAYRETGEPFGLCYWVFLMANAAIDILLETPMGAIPNYLILGLAVARVKGRNEPR